MIVESMQKCPNCSMSPREIGGRRIFKVGDCGYCHINIDRGSGEYRTLIKNIREMKTGGMKMLCITRKLPRLVEFVTVKGGRDLDV